MSSFGIAPVPSAGNSTSTPLAAGATFTGVWQLAPRSMALVQVATDAPGTLFFDFSVDGSTSDSTFPSAGTVIEAGIPRVEPATVGGRYFRIRIVNGSTPQSYLRAGTSFNDISNFYAPLDAPYGLSSPATLSRQTWTWLDVARGLCTDIESIKKFGRNDGIGTSFEPVALSGVYQTPQASAATTLRIAAGGNANDAAAGSGAREVTIEGLDENFDRVTETIATNGALASAATSNTFTRMYRMYVSQSGTYATASAGSHAGDIAIENSGGGTTWGVMDSTNFPKGQSEIGAYTVPAGYTGFIKLRDLTIDSGKTVDVVFFARAGADESAPPYSAMRAQSIVTGVAGGAIESFGSTDVPFGPYVGPTDVGFMAEVSAGSASCSIEFEIILIRNR